MTVNELLGIDPLPFSANLESRSRPVFGTISIAAPFISTLVLYLIYSESVKGGGDSWGFGFLISLMTGGAIGGFVGFPSAIISLVRKEQKWGLGLLGIVINVPLMLIAGSFVAELLKL